MFQALFYTLSYIGMFCNGFNSHSKICESNTIIGYFDVQAFVLLVIEPRALHMLGKISITELHCQTNDLITRGELR